MTTWIVEQAKKKIACHRCHIDIPKNAWKIKADLGRASRAGYIWWYQFCLDCGRKRLKEDIQELIDTEKKIDQKQSELMLAKRQEERLKWVTENR